MKKINLIEWLWKTDSHEKQKPQRFARYAAILIMLLTLGVGQMWADVTLYYQKDMPSGNYSASSSATMTQSSVNSNRYSCSVSLQNGSYGFYIKNGNNFYKVSATANTNESVLLYDYGSSNYGNSNHRVTYNTGAAGDFIFTFDASNNKVCVSKRDGLTIKVAWSTASGHDSDWNLGTYTTLSEEGSTGKYSADVDLTAVKHYMFVQTDNTRYWRGSSTLSVNNSTSLYYYGNSNYGGSGDKINFTPSAAAKYRFTWNHADKTIKLQRLYNISYQKGDYGTGSTQTDYKVHGTNITLRSSGEFSRTGYNHTAWNTSSTGSGGTSYTFGVSYTSNADLTLYPTWTAKTTTVTLSANAPAGETVTGGGTTVTATYDAALPAFSALTCTGGYALKGYYDNTSGGTKVINADGSFAANSGIWNRTDGATLTLHAQWSLDRTLTYDGNTNTSGNVPAAATNYANGTNVTVLGNVAGSPLVKTGYTFTGWNTSADGNGVAYAAGSTITMNANYTLYAQWQENMTTVNLVASPAGGGTFTVGGAAATSTTAGVTTTRSVAAVPYPGYRIMGSNYWTAQNANISLSSRSTNPTTVTGGGTAGTSSNLTATFTQTYAYLQGRMTIYTAIARSTKKHIATSEGGWDVSSNRIKMDYDGTNHRFYLHTYMTPKELSTAQTDGEQYFHFKTSTSSSSDDTNAQVYNPSTGRTLTAAGTGNKKETGSSDGSNNIWFDDNSTTNGYAIIYFDEAGVWYEVEHSLAYNVNGGSGTLPSTTCHLHGNNGTVGSGSSINKSQFTFSGWNTSQYITGTNYAAGDAITMNANTTLYAKWTRSITLNQNGGANGSSSVTATYNCSTLPSITNPSKLGYAFGGWYTANDGTGDIVINTSGALQANKSNWTDGSSRFTRTASDATLYAKWTQTVTLNANLANHGSGSNTSATIVLNAIAKSSITHCTPATGYQLEGYYTAATDGVKVLNADGSFADSNVTDYITDGKWTKAGATTLYAQYEPITYTITLNAGLGGTGSGTAAIDYDATACKTWTDNITQTGYHVSGWYSSSTKVLKADHTFAAENVSGFITSGKWSKADDCTLQAWWDPNGYTVTLNQQSGTTGHSADGTVANQSVAYNTILPTISGTAPTAANGYAFMGFYTEAAGAGVKLINANLTWVASVEGYTNASSQWKHDGDVTLYAYYKKAEITELAVSPVTADLGASVTATATVSPEPTGTTVICWKLLRSNGTEVGDQPTFSPENARSVSFNVPSSSGTYKVVSTLRLDGCEGTFLDSDTTNVIVAGVHTVTIQYKCGSDVIQSPITVEATPLDWTDVSAPDIFGYYFTGWTEGDGITLESSTSTNPNRIKASYSGTLTANYAKRDYIYFKNTLGWANDNIYVYFYADGGYFDNNNGAGATGDACIGKGKMSLVDGETDILYWDYGAGIPSGGAAAATKYVAFTWGDGTGHTHFNGIDVVYPYNGNVGHQGFNSGTPMFVPLEKTVQPNPNYRKNNNATPYFDRGYWTKYLGGTGYSIDIFYSKGGAHDKSVAFEGDGTHEMPYTATVNLTGGSTLGIKIHRSSGIYYYSTTDINMGNASTAKDLTYNSGASNQTGIQTNASGDYVFTLTCAASGELQLSVKYPAAQNDYRIVYNDRVAWSGSAHNANWIHPSAVIPKNTSATDPKTDIVSFYVSKAPTANASMKFQYISSITNSSITWTDVTDGGINLNDITESGVYNFYLSQPAGGATIQVDSIKPYTGDYYIRSAMANSKWDNYTTDPSHLMNYSDYAEQNRGYSHYWVKFVSVNSDIRYVIANDYSPCISDTLVSEASQPITIDGEGKMTAPNTGVNIRSMWNQKTNKLSRAFITGPIHNEYLLLRSEYQSNASNNRLFKSWTNPSTYTRLNHASFTENSTSYDLDTLLFIDKQNWIYELDLYARPSATYKLTALVNGNTTFFRGAAGNYTTAANVDTVIGGNASGTTAYHVRMIYDFKTDRMVKAWMPTGAIDTDLPINADIMIVRNHQEEGQQITFNGGSLQKVHNAYGVMRFNRWTLNNKSTEAGHAVLPVGDQKSSYERALYWISFPFDVNLSDVFGFGTYGEDWIIEYYDGASRAANGYWIDSPGFWEYVMPSEKASYVLEAGKGYVLALDLDKMKSDNTDFWSNGIEEIELFFPSAEEVKNISQTQAHTTVDSHECTIDRTVPKGGADINKNRTKADAHWNVIGIPSYANHGNTLTKNEAGTQIITWNSSPYTNDLPFLYEWQCEDNSYVVQSGTTFPFLSMHAYMVQYSGDIYWALASASSTPASVARRTYAGAPQNVEFRMELQQNSKRIDQTFVKLSNDEEVSANFSFNEDLAKEFNKNKANIYTIVENYIPTAGNVLPMTEQTTVVPVGVKIATTGDYTFAIPSGTNGVGVTLVDLETGVRTNLALFGYNINLEAGDYNDRFLLEISPIQHISEGVDEVNGEGLEANGVRKVLIDNVLYIIRDGKVFDAQGKRLH